LEQELETHGGRDLHILEDDWSQRKPLRDVNEWGRVDVEAVTMSLRSRISTEVSYALTTLTLISTMKGQTPGTGFPIAQCEDLMEELLDLLEEEAFGGAVDAFESSAAADAPTITHREIINAIHEQEMQPFASLEHRQGAKERKQGPKPRPGHTILVIINLLRNLTLFSDNTLFMATHERFLSLFLWVSSVVWSDDGQYPRPASIALSLSDVVIARRDTLHVVLNLAHMIHLSPTPIPSKSSLRMASCIFALVASYLVDPTDAVSPVAYVKQVGLPPNGPIKPPSVPDVALQVFTFLGYPDSNRQIFSQAVSQARIWNMFEALVHRLPVTDVDFQLMTQDLWLGYLEKVIMAIYALAFLSPPALKRKIKADRTLGFGRVMLRMVQKFLLAGGPQGRTIFMVSAKRAVEAMKVIDDGKDSFDTSQSTSPTLAFGMGWGEVGDNGPEKGTGLLGGHLEVTWDLLMQREVDEMMFSELESLARVDY
jgi:SWI/SNF chromatin-remodeling complex subunit SWI1